MLKPSTGYHCLPVFRIGRISRRLFMGNKKETSFEISRTFESLFSSNGAALLLNSGCLTCELAQIVKLSATDLTYFVDLDAIDSR